MREECGYVEGTIILITMLDRWVATVLGILVEKQKRGRFGQKHCKGLYGEVIEATTSQII